MASKGDSEPSSFIKSKEIGSSAKNSINNNNNNNTNDNDDEMAPHRQSPPSSPESDASSDASMLSAESLTKALLSDRFMELEATTDRRRHTTIALDRPNKSHQDSPLTNSPHHPLSSKQLDSSAFGTSPSFEGEEFVRAAGSSGEVPNGPQHHHLRYSETLKSLMKPFSPRRLIPSRLQTLKHYLPANPFAQPQYYDSDEEEEDEERLRELERLGQTNSEDEILRIKLRSGDEDALDRPNAPDHAEDEYPGMAYGHLADNNEPQRLLYRQRSFQNTYKPSLASSVFRSELEGERGDDRGDPSAAVRSSEVVGGRTHLRKENISFGHLDTSRPASVVATSSLAATGHFVHSYSNTGHGLEDMSLAAAPNHASAHYQANRMPSPSMYFSPYQQHERQPHPHLTAAQLRSYLSGYERKHHKHWSVFTPDGIEAARPGVCHYLHVGRWVTLSCDYFLHRFPASDESRGHSVLYLHNAKPHDRFVFLISPVEIQPVASLISFFWKLLYTTPPLFALSQGRVRWSSKDKKDDPQEVGVVKNSSVVSTEKENSDKEREKSRPPTPSTAHPDAVQSKLSSGSQHENVIRQTTQSPQMFDHHHIDPENPNLSSPHLHSKAPKTNATNNKFPAAAAAAASHHHKNIVNERIFGVQAVEVLHSDVTAMDYSASLVSTRLAIESRNVRCLWFSSKEAALRHYQCENWIDYYSQVRGGGAGAVPMQAKTQLLEERRRQDLNIRQDQKTARKLGQFGNPSPGMGPASEQSEVSIQRHPTRVSDGLPPLPSDVTRVFPPSSDPTQEHIPGNHSLHSIASVPSSRSPSYTTTPHLTHSKPVRQSSDRLLMAPALRSATQALDDTHPSQLSFSNEAPNLSPDSQKSPMNHPMLAATASSIASQHPPHAVTNSSFGNISQSLQRQENSHDIPPFSLSGAATEEIHPNRLQTSKAIMEQHLIQQPPEDGIVTSEHSDTIVVVYTQDPTFRDLLKEVLMPDQTSTIKTREGTIIRPGEHHPFTASVSEQRRLLALLEAGMPSWTIFFARWGLPYRRVFRLAIVALVNIWPLIGLSMGMYDLYKHMPYVKDFLGGTALFSWIPESLTTSLFVTYLFTVTIYATQSLHGAVKTATVFINFIAAPFQPIIAALQLLSGPAYSLFWFLYAIFVTLLQPLFLLVRYTLTLVAAPYYLVKSFFGIFSSVRPAAVQGVQTVGMVATLWRYWMDLWEKVLRPLKNLAKAIYDGIVHVGVAISKRDTSMRRAYRQSMAIAGGVGWLTYRPIQLLYASVIGLLSMFGQAIVYFSNEIYQLLSHLYFMIRAAIPLRAIFLLIVIGLAIYSLKKALDPIWWQDRLESDMLTEF